ncbi:MAG: hypothetical protein ACLUVC_07515 [Longibaculum sp.]
MTRKEERSLERNNMFKEVLRVINHYFPDLFKIMNSVDDPRHQSCISYKQSDLPTAKYYRVILDDTVEEHLKQVCFGIELRYDYI